MDPSHKGDNASHTGPVFRLIKKKEHEKHMNKS